MVPVFEKKKYLPTAKQTRIPTHENRDDNKRRSGPGDVIASPSKDVRSRVVRPSVRRSSRELGPQCACVQSGAEQCACVRSCVRVPVREQRRRRRRRWPTHSRGGKRSQQVGSAARRLRRPPVVRTVYSSDLYARARLRRVFHVSSSDHHRSLCVVVLIPNNSKFVAGAPPCTNSACCSSALPPAIIGIVIILKPSSRLLCVFGQFPKIFAAEDFFSVCARASVRDRSLVARPAADAGFPGNVRPVVMF